MKRVIYALIFSLFALIIVSFALINIETVKFSYYLATVELPLSLIIALSIAVGSLMGMAAGLGLILKLKHQINKLSKSVKLTEKEVLNLRSLPIKD